MRGGRPRYAFGLLTDAALHANAAIGTAAEALRDWPRQAFAPDTADPFRNPLLRQKLERLALCRAGTRGRALGTSPRYVVTLPTGGLG